MTNRKLLDPDMPADQLRLLMGELTSDELLVARASIRWANSQAAFFVRIVEKLKQEPDEEMVQAAIDRENDDNDTTIYRAVFKAMAQQLIKEVEQENG